MEKNIISMKINSREREGEREGERKRQEEIEIEGARARMLIFVCFIVSNFSECLCVRMFVRVSVMLAGRTNIS